MAHLKKALDDSAPAVHWNAALADQARQTMLAAELGSGRVQGRWRLRVGLAIGLAATLLAGQVSVAVGLPGMIADALMRGPDHTHTVAVGSATCEFTIRVAPATTSEGASESTEAGLKAAEQYISGVDFAGIDTALEEQNQANQLDPSTSAVTVKGMALTVVLTGMVAEELESQGYSESVSLESSADCSQ